MSSENDATTWLETYDEVCDAFSHPALLQASYESAKKTIFADVLVTLDGPEHLQRRRAELALVRPPMVSLFEQQLVPDTARRLLSEFAKTGEVDLVEVLRIVTTAMAAEIIGLDHCDTVEQLDRLERLTRTLHAGATVDWSLMDPAEIVAEANVAREQYRIEFLQPSLDRRRDVLAHGNTVPEKRIDLITVLLQNQELPDMNEAKILRESIHFLLATAHTSSSAVIHALDDFWKWLADHPDDVSRLKDAGFIQRCIHETLRLQPPTGFQKRIAAENCTLKSGRTLRAGELIGLNLVSASRDPKAYGSDSTRYDPDRKVSSPIPRFGLAFGFGPHICLGKRLSTGATDPANGAGVLVALFEALLNMKCRPHPITTPVEQLGTLRHQFRTYMVTFN